MSEPPLWVITERRRFLKRRYGLSGGMRCYCLDVSNIILCE